jgi:hypothetical protein
MSQNFQVSQVSQVDADAASYLAPVSAVPYVAPPSAASPLAEKVVPSSSQGNQDKEFEERSNQDKEFEDWSIQDKRAYAREWAAFYVAGILKYPDNNMKCVWGLSKLEEQVCTDPNPCMSWDEFQALVKEEHRRNEPDVSASSPMAASSPLALDD